MGILGSRALDIDVCDEDLCTILGYLLSPGRVGLIEAQIPEDRIGEFRREYPGQVYYPITQGYTSGGNTMKQGCQFRIYFNNISNCPPVLKGFLGQGTGNYVKRINKGKFIEKIIENYGFRFGEIQDVNMIRNNVINKFPKHIAAFEAGYNL